MLITPFDFQNEAVDYTFNYFAHKPEGNPVIAMPTGTGKSVVIGSFLYRTMFWYKNQRILILTHVRELVEQNYLKFLSMWPQAPCGIYSAGLNRRDTRNPIIFGGIASVAGKAALFGHIDLIIIDEAHLVSPHDQTMYQKFISDLAAVNKYIRVIGLTATPWRLGQGSITEEGSLFTDMCYDLTGVTAFNKLIERGHLSPLIPKKTDTFLDVEGVHTRGGEFIQSELQQVVDQDYLTRAALAESADLGQNRNCWMVFTAGIDHAVHANEILNDMGIRSKVVHSKISKGERDKAIAEHKAGYIRAIVNANALTTGYDNPRVDMIVILRPTASSVLWVQILGRGTRCLYAPGFDLRNLEQRLQAVHEGGKEDCLVLDFARNTKRLGPINDPVVPKKKGKAKGDAPIKECPACNTYNHAGVRFCISCNYEFKFETKLHQESATDELIKVDEPVVEVFKVDHITYEENLRDGRAPIMKVSYYCGLRKFTDMICIEHEGFAGRKARRWWSERSNGMDCPQTSAIAVENATKLKAPTNLRIWINKRYPEILAYCYDGSNFGTEEPSGEIPHVQAYVPKVQPAYEDDDIPF